MGLGRLGKGNGKWGIQGRDSANGKWCNSIPLFSVDYYIVLLLVATENCEFPEAP